MKYDLLTFTEDVENLIVQGGQISSLFRKSIKKQGLRRFENGRVSYASKMGEASIEKLIDASKQSSGTPYDYELGEATCEARQSSSSLSQEVLEEFAESFQEFKARFPNFVFHGRCSLIRKEVTLNSSWGSELRSEAAFVDWYFTFMRKGSGNSFDGFIVETSSQPDFRTRLNDLESYLEAQSRPVSIKPGFYPVLLDECEPLTKFAKSLDIDRYHTGAALYSSKFGERIFSNKLSIYDESYDPEHGQLQFFDGEGIVRENSQYDVVENGVFTHLLSDRRLAKKYGVESSGNGVRDYKSGVSLKPNSLRFRAGERSWKQIAQDLDKCIIVHAAAGGSINDLGEYSSPVQLAYLYEKGELVGLLPQLTIHTSLDKYFGDALIDVAKDGLMSTPHLATPVSEMKVGLA